MAGNYVKGVDKLFRGILSYRQKWKSEMVKQLKEVSENPSPIAVFMTCVDARLQPTKFTKTNVGDMFVSRNVGNIVPNAKHFDTDNPSPEPGLLELGCVANNIANVVICGHSDCKAMNLLYTMKGKPFDQKTLASSPIRAWLQKHATHSLDRFTELEKADFKQPLNVNAANQSFPAYIDVDNNFSVADKLSQVNALIQMENVASYPFMAECVGSGKTHLHAMWYDIHSGEIHYFSRTQKTFLPILDSNADQLLTELAQDYFKEKDGKDKCC